MGKMMEEPNQLDPLAVTVVSGFLGSGKTTLLKHVLDNKQGLKVAVIVNDMGAVNIDAKTVKRNNQQDTLTLVELENGCICCTLREDLMIQIAELAGSGKYDYLVIESSGVSEPIGVAESFVMDPVEFGGTEAMRLGIKKLSDVSKLDTMVTVIDGFNFPTDLDTTERAQQRWGAEEVDDEDDRNVSDLMVDQVEFANVIVINKLDLLDEKRRLEVVASVKALNVKAKVIETSFSKVPLKEIVNTGTFSMEQAQDAPGWLQEMKGVARPPETEEYGISSFVYRRRRPFNPKKFWDASRQMLEDKQIVRSKGFCWLATRNQIFGDWNQAGATCSLNVGAFWFSELPEEEWGSDDPNFIQQVKEEFHEDPSIGDRRQELVIIGIKFDKEKMERLLDTCLLTEEEFKMGPEKWVEMFEDPFPEWVEEEDDDEDEEMDEGDDDEANPDEEVDGDDDNQ